MQRGVFVWYDMYHTCRFWHLEVLWLVSLCVCVERKRKLR